MPDPTNDTFEDLLVRVVDAMETDGAAGAEAVCAAHPEHAARLRSHVRRLTEFGLLAGNDANGAVAGLPERLGDYRPLRRIGGGGMGNVYVAEQTSLGRRVAIKLIRPEQLWFTGARARFEREVHAIAKLQHPGIVPVYDAGETAGLPWLAMELVEGAPLDELLTVLAARRAVESLTGADLEKAVEEIVARRREPGAPASNQPSSTRAAVFTGTWVNACLRIARAVADALVHAHDRGVLHRDVKPSNVMLTPDGRALLLDFGLAQADGAVKLTQDRSQLGSPAYMSPEQIRGEADLDARTDVWSLGVTLYELLALRAPFADESAERTRTLVLEARPRSVRRCNETVPRDVEIVCHTAMSAERDRRYPTMRAFATDLDNLLELRPVHARPPTPWLLLRRWVQRRPAAAIAVLAAVLLLVVAPTVFWLQQRSANESIREALATAERHRDREQKAREQAQRDRDAAREVVQQWLVRVGSEELVDAPHMQQLRRDLLGAARSYHERFLAESGDDPALLAQAAESTIQLATIRIELGEQSRCADVVARGVELAAKLVDLRGRDAASLALLAEAKSRAASLDHAAGRLDAAHATIAEAVALMRESFTLEANSDHRRDLISLLRTAALVANALHREDEVVAHHAAIRELATLDDDLPRSVRQMAVAAAADEAYFHLRAGRADAADVAAQRVIEWRAEADENDLSSIERIAAARAFDVAGRIARAGGDRATGERLARRCVAEAELVLEDLPEHANALRLVAGGLNSLAFAIASDPNRRTEAEATYERSIATMRKLIAVDSAVVEPRINLATSLVNLGSMRMDRGDLDAAKTLLIEAADLAASGHSAIPTNVEAPTTLHNAVWFLGQLAGKQRDHRGQADAALRLAALRPDEARTQRIAGALLAEACALVAADRALPDDERRTLLAARQTDSLRLLSRAADLGCTDHGYLATHAHLAAVRDLPGFAEIVARMTANEERQRAR